MKIIQKIATVAFITINLVSCTKKEAPFEDPLITNRDTTISPSEDFFHYANGGSSSILFHLLKEVTEYSE